MKPLVLGGLVAVKGDITSNNWVAARSARALEQNLGYGTGRLSAGWWILLLKQKLTPDDFKFSGTTLRSGGRYGLPADDPEADRARTHVYEKLQEDYGAAQVEKMKQRFLASAQYQGPERLVKIIPVTPHSDTEAPNRQYPMGGGGGQWTLVKECEFLVAVKVDGNGIARTPGFSVFLGESANYEDRARLRKYLDSA